MRTQINIVLILRKIIHLPLRPHSTFPLRYDSSRSRMASKKLAQMLSANPIVLLSKTTCPYCIRLKATLAGYPEAAEMLVVELNQEADGAALQAAAANVSGQRTVPQLFVRGKSLGGNDDCQRLHSQGVLAKALSA